MIAVIHFQNGCAIVFVCAVLVCGYIAAIRSEMR